MTLIHSVRSNQLRAASSVLTIGEGPDAVTITIEHRRAEGEFERDGFVVMIDAPRSMPIRRGKIPVPPPEA